VRLVADAALALILAVGVLDVYLDGGLVAGSAREELVEGELEVGHGRRVPQVPLGAQREVVWRRRWWQAASVDEELLGLVIEALRFAADHHCDQRRKDGRGSPYINHPIEVAHLLWTRGRVRDPITLMAALLHDTVEDTEATIEDIERAFGSAVAGVVAEVTDDKSLPKAERKQLQVLHAPKKSPRAKLVKLGDKISNLGDLLDSPPFDWAAERRRDYAEWAAAVVDGLADASPELAALFDELYQRCVIELGARTRS